MLVTNLPSADENYKCDPKLNTTLSSVQVNLIRYLGKLSKKSESNDKL